MRNLSQIVSYVETLSNVKDQTSFVKDSVQIALDRIFQYHDWPYYLQEGVLETVELYDTGNVDVTNGSKTVSGGASAPVFTEAMVGRKFRVNGESPYYRIAAWVGATEITLEKNYQGDDATDQDYEIYQDEYRLTADVDKYKFIRNIQNSLVLRSESPSDFDSRFPTPSAYGEPFMEVMIGTRLDVYDDGTVTASSKTITGTGTEWTGVKGLGRMSLIRIGNNVYTIESVDSDTQLTVYETVTTVGAATNYEIPLRNIVVQLYNIPNEQRLQYYRYFRKPAPLVNDYDTPDIPTGAEWTRLLAYGALSEVLTHKGDVTKSFQIYESKFVTELERLKVKYGSFAPNRIYVRKSADRIHRVPLGRENEHYDRRYS